MQKMATESNSGFRHDDSLGSMINRHAISFGNSSSEMIPMGNYFGSNFILPGNSSIVNSPPGFIQTGNASGSSLLVDSVPGLKHEAGPVEWSRDEQKRLDEGLEKYKDEPNIMKYIKIAAILPEKTVRDVALRCRWMHRKRWKPEEQSGGKKHINRKDKLVESCSKTSMCSALPQSMGMYPPTMHHQDYRQLSIEGGGSVMHLLEQNAQAFNQIRTNISTYKFQDNIDLFYRTRDNIASILNDMQAMPGIMSQMPPLPISINEDLASSIMPSSTQSMMYGLAGGIHLKREPRC